MDFGERPGDRRVVVDPIDGSLNARRTIPSHSLSIAVSSGRSMADVEVRLRLRLRCPRGVLCPPGRGREAQRPAAARPGPGLRAGGGRAGGRQARADHPDAGAAGRQGLPDPGARVDRDDGVLRRRGALRRRPHGARLPLGGRRGGAADRARGRRGGRVPGADPGRGVAGTRRPLPRDRRARRRDAGGSCARCRRRGPTARRSGRRGRRGALRSSTGGSRRRIASGIAGGARPATRPGRGTRAGRPGGRATEHRGRALVRRVLRAHTRRPPPAPGLLLRRDGWAPGRARRSGRWPATSPPGASATRDRSPSPGRSAHVARSACSGSAIGAEAGLAPATPRAGCSVGVRPSPGGLRPPARLLFVEHRPRPSPHASSAPTASPSCTGWRSARRSPRAVQFAAAPRLRGHLGGIDRRWWRTQGRDWASGLARRGEAGRCDRSSRRTISSLMPRRAGRDRRGSGGAAPRSTEAQATMMP